MKIFLIITVLVVFIFIGFLLFYRQDDTTVLVGTIKDLESSIEKMMMSTKEDVFVIATIYGTDYFIQFSGNAKNVQLDFPQITDRQRSMETRFRTTAKEMNLKVIENRGTGGELFLDIDLKGTAAEISVVARSFIERFFNITQDTKIEYKLNI
jgi:hypothetical protein